MAFPQTIMGKWGWENETSTSQKHKLGTKMQIADCTFVYASAGEGVTVGQLMESSAVEGNENDDLAVATAAVGATSLSVTFGGAVTLDEYKDGFLFVNTATASGGYQYRIKGNAAGTSAVNVDLDHEDGIVQAITNGTDTVGCFKNHYDSVLQSNLTPVGPVVGVTRNDIASASYGWLQVSGPSVVLIQGTPAAGAGLMRSDGTEGAVEVLAEGSTTIYASIGHMGRTIGVNGEYHSVFLNILP